MHVEMNTEAHDACVSLHLDGISLRQVAVRRNVLRVLY